MFYHPIIGITIFVIAIIISFYLGRILLKKSNNKKRHTYHNELNDNKNPSVPKGEITSPDAPWLKDR